MIITTFEKDEAMVSDVFIYLNHVYQNMKKAKQGKVLEKVWWINGMKLANKRISIATVAK